MSRQAKVLVHNALHADSPLRTQVEKGLRALKSQDAKLIHELDRSKVGDSLDLDAASRSELPEAHRWDYLVSVPENSELIGLEPHSSRDDEISVVIAKKKSATSYLRSHLRDGQRIQRWIWLSRGKVGFSRMDGARRRLDQHGIEFAGQNLRLTNSRTKR